MPQTVEANGFTVQFKVNDRLFKWTSNNPVSLAGGYQYTLNLTAGKDKVSSAAFSSNAWNTGEGGSNDLSGKTE